ncbi:hypothetical protein M378DRAFT_160057 [Amanita muscaria Koide BX008]|uniref:F-box domain-containing protein n=1 Tax=Amanita muscaria (strain Koide BX008) TaxID=946122 RepID=A0A0C2XCH1_AMAMK|nr:hypothetical protein M378DRAFT_160057 [Amanita muscaria Koide BX008]
MTISETERTSVEPDGGSTTASTRLSDELWAEIFSFCLPSSKFVKPSPQDAPLLLCNVCSDWRHIALTTPKLWSSLAVHIIRPSELTPVFVQSWIDRSGVLPLSLSLETSPLCSNSTEDTLDKTVSVLFSYASRWLNISFTLSSPIGNALPTLENAPLLREFSLHPSPYSKTRYAIPFNIAPHLRRFKWTPCWDLLAVRGIPWNQLTHLVLERGLSLLGCIDALRLCPMLVECGLSATLVQSITPFSPPISHNNLRVLRITTDEHLGVFFDSLVIPHLEGLMVDIEDEYVHDFLTGYARHVDTICPQLVDFVTRSGCILSSLMLRNTCFEPEELVDCLQICPELRALSICNGRQRGTVTDSVVHRLTVQSHTITDPSSSPPVLCPNLRQIQLINSTNCSNGLLGQMVESRHNHPTNPLTLFSGATSKKLSDPDIDILRACAKSGLRVAFQDGSTAISES